MFYSRFAPKIWLKEMDGRPVFYPCGRFWKGYIVDEIRLARIERLAAVSLLANPLIVVALLSIVQYLTPFRAEDADGLLRTLLGTTLIALGLSALIYVLTVSSLLRDCPASPVRITLREIDENAARLMPGWLLLVSLVLDIACIAVSLFAVYRGAIAGTPTIIAAGAICLLFFASVLYRLAWIMRRNRALRATSP